MTKEVKNTNEVLASTNNANFKKNENMTKRDKYNMNAADIFVDWSKNTRTDYGTVEMVELKESILANGVLMPLTLIFDHLIGKLRLSHGYRRMKAIHELIAEGHTINVDVRKSENEESELLEHLTLNSGKPLNDFEIGETLLQYQKITKIENLKEIATKTGLDYQKVVKLINFAKSAGTQLKNAVAIGEVVLTNAIEFVQETPSIAAQNEILAVAQSNPIVLKNSTKKVELPTKKKEQNKKDKEILKTAKKSNPIAAQTAPIVNETATETATAATETAAPIAETATETTQKDNYSYLWQVLEEANASAFNTQLQKLLVTLEKGEATIEELVALID